MTFASFRKKKKDTAQNQINPHRSDKVIRLGECSVMLFKCLPFSGIFAQVEVKIVIYVRVQWVKDQWSAIESELEEIV